MLSQVTAKLLWQKDSFSNNKNIEPEQATLSVRVLFVCFIRLSDFKVQRRGYLVEGRFQIVTLRRSSLVFATRLVQKSDYP